VNTPKRTTASAAVRVSLSISVSSAIGDEPSTSPDAGLEARRSRTGLNYLLEFKRTSSSSFDLSESESKDTQVLSCTKQIIIAALAELGALGSYVLKPYSGEQPRLVRSHWIVVFFRPFLRAGRDGWKV
jgi:hypothetical protein